MKLFSPYQIKNLTLKNRVVMPPMCMYSAVNNDGRATAFHMAHYGARAIGQVGLVIVEATGVRAEGRITDACLGIWEDEQLPGLCQLAHSIRALSAAPAIQLIHAGRKSTTSATRCLAPSAIPYNDHLVSYHEMTEEDIRQVVRAFGEAARRAHAAGFEGLEIHGAHGYLIHQFLSPLSNQRKDKYGADRSLFLKEVVAAIAEKWPEDKALWIRISATDWLQGGISPQDWVGWLKALPRPMDMVHVSSGGLQKAPVQAYPGYMLPLAQEIKRGTGLPVIAVGFLDDDQMAVHALASGACDLVALGRALLRQPNKVLDMAARFGVVDQVPKQYERAYLERI